MAFSFIIIFISNEVQLKWKHSVTFLNVTYHTVSF